jgi:predicted enzyme related to lactoylglutathione lyase
MGTLGSRNVNVITLFNEDLKDAMSFYQEIFGLSAVYEDDKMMWMLYGHGECALSASLIQEGIFGRLRSN